MTSSRVMSWVLALALLGCPACFGGFDGLGEAIGRGFACAFDFEFGHQIESDHGQLEAQVSCEPNVDCADVRTVAVGASFEVNIQRGPEREEPLRAAELRIVSSDPRVLEVEGFVPMDGCDVEIPGSVTFREAGEAALIVYRGAEEIDRFTVTASEVVSAELQMTSFVGEPEDLSALLSGEWTPVGDRIVLDERTHSRVRVIARSASGARLIGAKPVAMWVDDPALAHVDADVSSPLVGRKLGTTTLRARIDRVRTSVLVEVVGLVPDGGADFSDDDAGVADASADTE